MSVKELYELWRNRATGDPDLMEELQSISKDEDGI